MIENGIIQPKFIGRFGNQMFQYCSARAWARLVGARFECPPWLGSQVFDLHDLEPSVELPEVNDGASSQGPAIQPGQTNVRIGGYFQTQRWVRLFDRTELQLHFRIRQEWLDAIGRARGSWDGWYAAAHVRQGDYIGHWAYANVPESAYVHACEEYGIPRDRVRWVRQDTPQVVGGIPSDISFLPDFVTLLQADVLLRANSSFSWWAGALGNAREIFSPVVEDRVGPCPDAQFVRGNWPKTAHASRVGVHVDDLYLPE